LNSQQGKIMTYRSLLLAVVLLGWGVGAQADCPRERLVIAQQGAWGAQDYSDYKMVENGHAAPDELQAKKRLWVIPENSTACLKSLPLVTGAVSVAVTLQGLPLELYVDGSMFTLLAQR
jgi:hypothetical protein